MSNQRDQLRDEEIEAVVRKTLISLGIDLDDPIEHQADAQFVRKLRQAHERIGVKAIATLVGVLITGSISLVIVGAIALFKQKTGG